MIIWGSKGKEKVVAEGQFYCPQCRTIRPYIHKRVSRYFTLYFVPLFETKLLGEYIECEVCCTPFKVEVLELTESAEREFQLQQQRAKAVEAISNQLDDGVSLNLIAASLKNTGVKEDAAKAMLFAATKGKISFCEHCGMAYKATLTYCSTCGQPLKPYQPP